MLCLSTQQGGHTHEHTHSNIFCHHRCRPGLLDDSACVCVCACLACVQGLNTPVFHLWQNTAGGGCLLTCCCGRSCWWSGVGCCGGQHLVIFFVSACVCVRVYDKVWNRKRRRHVQWCRVFGLYGRNLCVSSCGVYVGVGVWVFAQVTGGAETAENALRTLTDNQLLSQ